VCEHSNSKAAAGQLERPQCGLSLREGPVTSATIWYHTTILLKFATPFNVACGAWSAITVVAIRHPRHPQSVDAETERRGRIRNIEFKVLMYTQLAVINNQRLCDFDTVVLKNGPHICKC
jgi:hypothetical protein